MNRIVPFEANYTLVRKFDRVLQLMLIASTIISILLIINKNWEWLNKVLAVICASYFVVNILRRFIYNEAEMQRKNDFMDNSLETKLSIQNSQGYFSNEKINPGIFKMGVNCFENSFFTKSITDIMLKDQIAYFLVTMVLIISVITYSSSEFIVQILLLALPYTILDNLIRILILNRNSNKIFRGFKSIFTSTKKNQMDSLIVNNTIEYEKALSWSSIPLDSDVFKKLNPKLSEQWSNIKEENNVR